MEAALQFAGLAVVVLVSISFALLLEWLSLWGLMKLMPATHPAPMPAVFAAPIPTALATPTPQRVVAIHSRRLRLHAAGR
ncbi:MAG: hypothetical protein WAK91_13955 [Candidatus Acidiferrales bacterium]